MTAGEAERRLIFEHLHAIREKAGALSADFAEVRIRLDALIAGFGGLSGQAGGIGARLDRLDARFARIERHLDAEAMTKDRT